MKNNSKRICALLLAVVMCITCVVPVFAESSDAHVHSETATDKCPGANAEHTTANSTYTFVDTVAPNCGEWGYDLNRCNVCSAPVFTNWTKLEGEEDHAFGEWVETVAPTCFELGKEERTCTRENCGHKESRPVALRAHDLKNDKPEGLTCRDTATWNVWCGYENCSYGKLESGEVDTAWNEGIDGQVNGTDCDREVVEITVRPTCDDEGVATVKCKVCGDVDENVEVKVTNGGKHSWKADEITVPATCYTAASGRAKCEYCGLLTEVIEGKISAIATLGLDEFAIVQFILVDDFAKLPHVFSTELTEQVDSTCTQTGTVPHYVCINGGGCTAVSLDGQNECYAEDILIPTIPHAWGDLVEKVDYTCTVDGMKAHKICTACGSYLDVEASAEKGEEVIVDKSALVLAAKHEFDVELDQYGKPSKSDALAFSDPTCTKFGFWFYGCSVCGSMPENDDNVNSELGNDDEGFIRPGVYRLPMLAHDTVTTTVIGSCTENATVIVECNDCNYRTEEVTVAPGHDWVKVDFAGTCQVKAHSYDKCSRCEAIRIETEETTESGRPTTNVDGWYNIGEKNYENHEWDPDKQVISTVPTCTEPGQSLDYCPYCSVYQDNVIPALGHNNFKYVETIAATCAIDGCLVYKCDRCKNDTTEVKLTPADLTEDHENYAENSALDLTKLGHDIEGVAPIYTGPTCTAPGYDTYKCVRYGQGGCAHTVKVVADDDGNVLYPALGHDIYEDPTDPECVSALVGKDGYVTEKCHRCDYSQKVADIKFDWNNPEHHPGSYVNPNSQYPNGLYREGDCEKSQLTDYYCPHCENTFFAEDDSMVGEHAIKDGTYNAGESATCLETGIYAHYECAICLNNIRVVGEKHEIYEKAEDLVSPALGHDWVLVEGSDPDCITAGAKDYYDCSRCELYTLSIVARAGEFSLADLDDAIYIQPEGHKFGALVPEVKPGCETEGFMAYYECSDCEMKFLSNEDALSEDYKDDAFLTIPATGHDTIDGDASIADCVTEGYVYKHCVTCDQEFVDEYVYPYGHKFGDLVAKVEPYCDSTGFEAHYNCSACNKKFTSNEALYTNEFLASDEALTIPATGLHKNANGETILDACTDATKDRFCVGCKATIAKNHTSKKTNHVNATCTEYGYDAWECLACGRFGRVEGSAVEEPTNPGHEKLDVPGYCYWDLDTKPATMYEAGEKYLRCNDCKVVLKTEEVPATGGIEFSFGIHNDIFVKDEEDLEHAAAFEFVNGGKIKLTIKYKAANVNIANIMLRLDYDKDVLIYDSGDFVCDAFDINNAAIGGNEAGTVVISAKTTGFGEEITNITLNGEGVFAEIYFDINKAAPAGSVIDFEVIRVGNSASKVLKALEEKDEAGRITYEEIPAIFGTADENGKVVSAKTKLLADIDTDGAFTNADEVEFLDIAFSNGYIAAADINQDGFIGLEDYDYLYDLILKNITYEELCEAAQA